jgi:hypothetical protein
LRRWSVTSRLIATAPTSVPSQSNRPEIELSTSISSPSARRWRSSPAQLPVLMSVSTMGWRSASSPSLAW